LPPADLAGVPITPAKCLKQYLGHLTEYERTEILDYPHIYYFGQGVKKIKPNMNAEKVQTMGSQSRRSSNEEDPNFGFDDGKGNYRITVQDHIAYRYEIIGFLGKGSFGIAVKAFDHKKKQEVAIKIIKNKKKYYYQAGVELKILQYLKENDMEDMMNIIHMKDYSVFRKHLCISFELMSINLYEFLKMNEFEGLSLGLIRRFAIQLLYALKYLRDHEVIHCDLKPENILLKDPSKSGIKIIDFGSSCF
jgi:dual specificity tyrosine-phosphorylation-regulated kinase 2/3/4